MDKIEELYSSYEQALIRLSGPDDVSLRLEVEAYLTKSLILGAASNYESRFTTGLPDFFEQAAGIGGIIPNLIRTKVVARQYHTWFQWDKQNINSFLSLFGADFRAHFIGRIRDDAKLDQAVKDFLDLGQTRNLLVHNDYCLYSLEKTAGDAISQYRSGAYFVSSFFNQLDLYWQERGGLTIDGVAPLVEPQG